MQHLTDATVQTPVFFARTWHCSSYGITHAALKRQLGTVQEVRVASGVPLKLNMQAEAVPSVCLTLDSSTQCHNRAKAPDDELQFTERAQLCTRTRTWDKPAEARQPGSVYIYVQVSPECARAHAYNRGWL